MNRLIVLFCSLLSLSAFAGPGHMTPVEMPKEFDALKALVGTWEGTANMHGKEEKVTVVYELTSGGTAITEKLTPGTEHEMTSIYYKDGKSLGMTHYCAMGNHPTMQMKKADDKAIAFEMTKPLGVSSMKEPHMHAVTLTHTDANTLTQEWTAYENGKKKDTVVFAFKRKN